MSGNRVLVLRQKIHGMDAAAYAATLEERLPEDEVVLATTPAEEREHLAEADVVTGLRLDPDELDVAEGLRLFACVFAGTGHLDLDAFTERDVVVTNASGVHGPNISEFVVGGMIAHAHRFGRARRQQARGHWRSYGTTEIGGSAATIVGLGAIGRAVATRLDAFDVHLTGVRYTPGKGGPVDAVYGFDEIHEAVADADHVVLACPLTDETAELIDDDVLRTMAPEALLVNVARGPVVDTDALVSALRWNGIGGAVLDVTDPEPLPADHPLWAFDNVLITPHNAGHTPAYFERMADIIAHNLAAIEAGEDAEIRNRAG